jgi:hypothetical protein
MIKISSNSTNTQRGIIGMIILLMMISLPVLGQGTNNCDFYLRNGLPKHMEINDDQPQRYSMMTDYFNKDIFGNFFNKYRVTGTYTRGLKDGQVSWEDVHVSESKDQDADFDEGVLLPYMEGFIYVPGIDMVSAESFAGFPANSVYAKNLVWDMMAFETFAWAYFDSLELNKTFYATEINNKVDLAGEGYFENKNIELLWTGISEMNDEICAVIEYITMDNPLEFKNEMFDMKGRSHYWGTIWVSLEDKHIEHGVMYEDVMMKMEMPSQPGPQMINSTREIVIEKLNSEL